MRLFVNNGKDSHRSTNRIDYKVKPSVIKEGYGKFCSHKCQYIFNSGENHPQWKGGDSPYPKEWNQIRREIRKRDTYLCMMCDRHQDEFDRSHSVHHIDGDKNNCNPNNLISLCARHHAIVEGSGDKKYTFWMPKFQKMLTKIHGYKYEEE